MKIHDCVQYDTTWWQLRAGIPTASSFDKIMTPAKCELSKSADKYICELIGDKRQQIPNFFSESRRPKSQPMAYGIDTEQQARDWFQFQYDEYEVQQVGFITTDDGRLGVSPDGLLLKAGEIVGGLELKCPMPDTHVGYLMTPNEVPVEYRPQVHGQLIVTGLPFVYFCSFCPGDWPNIAIRVTPNEYTAKLRSCLDKFLARYAEVEAMLAGPQTPAAVARPQGAVA